jgi:predicted component of type VI protein secretion system
MPERRLRETLDALHHELDQAESVNDDDRASLAHVADDIRALLDRSDTPDGGTQDSLLDQLAEATQRFEEEHPKLTAAINRVAAALSNLGI